MKFLNELIEDIKLENFVEKPAYIKEVAETFIKTKGPVSKIGDIFEDRKNGEKYEVISTTTEENIMMPIEGKTDIKVGSFLYKANIELNLPININDLKGKIIDCFGKPMDDRKFIQTKPFKGKKEKINPMSRERIKNKVETGIRAIDGLLTIGKGQKIGIFAGTGVGKSTLLGMIAKKSKEDINVIALIGERGREVREFIEKELGEEGMKRSIVVVSTSDETPLRQLRAADLATTIAEIFRDKGLNVLLMMDSITRFAIAKRTLDMANGDIPMMGGKTTSMESGLQKILERAGNNERGSITGIYTVLVENDDFNAPIPDMARGILDGHIVLTRRLADQNHFPAIDVLSSVSRVMQDITDQNHWTLSREIKKYLSIYMENEDEIKLGLIEKGVDREIDRSILIHKKIIHFLKQDINKAYTMEETLEDMKTTL
jgi:flagellum-specific ATP synthase